MLKRNLAVCIDLDDCIFSFLGVFVDLYNKRMVRSLNLTSMVDYNFNKQLSAFLHEIELEGLYSRLPLEFGASTFLDLLTSLKIKIIFITARPKEFKRDTIIALNNNNIDYEMLIFNKNKSEVINSLKNHYDVLAFIDDRASTVEKVFNKCGLNFTFLIDKPHNKNIMVSKGIERISNLMDAWDRMNRVIRNVKY